MNFTEEMETYVSRNRKATISLLKELTAIPAPTGREERRAAFCVDWLCRQGGTDARTDAAGNVVLPMAGPPGAPLVVYMAHMDTVFSDPGSIPVTEDAERLYAPGIGDDTANLVNLLMAVRFFLGRPELRPKAGMLFVADTGEEGMGNLRGSRRIFEEYGARISAFVSFDLYMDSLVNTAVGSQRYEITARTKGGHSLADFGSRNAIQVLAEIIQKLYAQVLPAGGRTTYNVGRIAGGTSVNTIAESARMLYEFRADRAENLAYMEGRLARILRETDGPDVRLEQKLLGVRPCQSGENTEEQRRFAEENRAVLARYSPRPVHFSEGSTDANLPLSLGIPAVTFGTVMGGGAHTREEWIVKESLAAGQKAAIADIGRWFVPVK